jgi:TM2 domain-containing membrane protein YozV
MQIHVARDGKELGVFSLEEINRQLAAGTLRLTDLAWYEGAAGWAALSTMPGVSATPASATPPVSPTVVGTAPTAVVPPPRKSEQLAVVSLIFSILGLCGFCCGFFMTAAIAGIICGHIALSRIKANPELEGRGLAMAGLIIGYVAVAGWLTWILLFGGLAVLQGISEGMKRH